jgi:hypothetical protein
LASPAFAAGAAAPEFAPPEAGAGPALQEQLWEGAGVASADFSLPEPFPVPLPDLPVLDPVPGLWTSLFNWAPSVTGPLGLAGQDPAGLTALPPRGVVPATKIYISHRLTNGCRSR